MAATAVGSPAGVQLALSFSEAVFGVCAAVAGLLAAALSLRLPRGVGTAGPVPDAPGGSRGGGGPRRFGAGAPWLALGLLLAAMSAAGALIGRGVGIVQTLTLHMSMRRMDPGRASVMWNLGVDGGLWIGGILWGVALASGVVGAGALVVSVVVLALGGAVAFRRRQRC